MVFQEDAFKVDTVGVTESVKIGSSHFAIDHDSCMNILPQWRVDLTSAVPTGVRRRRKEGRRGEVEEVAHEPK
jgi:hypothetical protein